MRGVALLLFGALCSTACTDTLKSSRINPQTIAVYPGGERRGLTVPAPDGGCPFTQAIGDSNRGAINLDCFRFPESVGENRVDSRLAYDLAAGVSNAGTIDPEKARVYRNRLASILMKQADDICTVEKGRMVRTDSGGNFLFSLLTTGLSTSATIVTGERAKTVLSALATASNATQDNFNSSFYKNQLIQAIAKSMDEERGTRSTGITGKFATTIDLYPVDQMIWDINQYHQACSFEHGLQRLLDAALDANGARATLRGLANAASLRELEDRKKELIADLANPNLDSAAIKTQLNQVTAKITAIVLAEADSRTERPSAGDAATAAKAAADK